ncbi:MAG TPA: hypothetical protein VLG44_05480 [Chlamydiales bacterium]|nr:hypothetical protein [Chlamydiales bacterium]
MARAMHDSSYSAFRLLQVAFIIAPILAGFDKFFNLMTNWSQYLSPLAMKILHNHDRPFMMIVGVVEIIVGIGMIFKPRVFAYIAAAWIFLIFINLLIAGAYLDIALRDLGLCLGAIALGQLSLKYD